MSVAVQMTGITKRFGDVKALDEVSLEVAQGSIHAIVGENGAGKTTLMRVLYGATSCDEGEIELFDVGRKWRNSADAIAHGIGMVSQHYSIIPELTCLQNLVLGAEPSYLLSREQMTERATRLAQQMGFSFDWDALASSLSPSSAQKLEIVKLLWRESKVMVLDEPTAMLSPADADALYTSLRQLAADGATVIVVTHRIPEVMMHCRRVTVLRGGRKVADLDVAATNAEQLAELIIGHSLERNDKRSFETGPPILQTKSLVVKGQRHDDAVKGANLTVSAGEIVGIAGVDGNGQRELFHALVGTLPVASGSIVFRGNDITRSRASARLKLGLRLIPEDRHEEGVIEDWSLVENAALGLHRTSALARGNQILDKERAQLATRVADRFKTRHPGLNKPMRSLSGGNQQRFVAARALELDPKAILAFQPARGLDIDAAAQVYAALREECANGACALVVSFDLDELLENCDRIVVMHGGSLTEPRSKDRHEIGRLMVGAT